MNQGKLILYFVFLFIFHGQLMAQRDNIYIKDIVLINSYHTSFEWTKAITESVVREFPERENYRISIENIDSKRFNKEHHLELFSQYLKEKYGSIKVDGIICSDNHAFEFVLKNRDELWKDVPVSFCGVNNIQDFTDIDTLNIKGVDETIDIKGTIELILKINPQLYNLLVVSDSTLSGKLFMKQFEETASMFFPTLDYTPIYAVSSEMLHHTLSQFSPRDKAIYLLSLYVDRSGIPQNMYVESELLKQVLDVPIYSNWYFMLNHGVLGGVMQRGADQGKEVAHIMRKMLEGKADSLPFITPSKSTTIVDYKELTRHFPNQRLSSNDAQFINKPLSFVEKNKIALLILSSLFCVFLLVIVLLMRVIAIKKAAEQQIRKGEERLELALEGANIGLWDFDLLKQKSFLSEKSAILLGYSGLEELTFDFDNLFERIHPEDIQRIKEMFFLHLAGFTNNFKEEIRIKTANDGYKWFSLLGIVTEKENENPQRVIGVIMDIHSQKIFEEELKNALAKAEESDRLKSSFLANMSHEIRTPMNAILGFSDILIQNPVSPEETLLYLKLIRDSGSNLLNLINDIIDISKMESGKFTLYPETFDLHALLERIKLMAQTIINKQKNKDVDFRLIKDSDQKQYFVFADLFSLDKILDNLITNAVKFTEKGYIELSYQIIDDNHIAFTVIDTGIGISAENQKVIFDRFRQINSNDYESRGGVGLGLSITKNLVEMMDGKIEVVSETLKGTKFTFTIPCVIKM